MTSIPLPSDPILSWAAYYWSQWFVEFMVLQIASYAILIYFLRRLYKENLGEKVGDMLLVLGSLGLKTKSPDKGETQFESSAVKSMLANFPQSTIQKDGLQTSATGSGEGLPGTEVVDLNKISSVQLESAFDEHSVKQCISNLGEKSL